MSNSWLAAQGRLPLAFMGLALAWLAAALVILLAAPGLLSAAHVHPHVVGLVHAWILGFFVTVACGAVYQLAPVALGTTLVNERHGWWHFWLHLVGVPGMVISFWIWDVKLLSHFGSFVAMGILLFSVNVWRTIRQAKHPGVVSTSIALSVGWLLLTVLAGLLLAANRFWHFIPVDPVFLLRAHAHLGLVGFFLTLIQGVAMQLVPMFTLGSVLDWRLPARGLWGSQIGLLVLVPSLTVHWSLGSFIGALIITAGISSTALGLAKALKTRRKRKIDPGVIVFLTGVAMLILVAISGTILVAPWTPWGSAPGQFGAMVYGVGVLCGALLPCIAGMMCKVVPFLTWMRAYGPKVGHGATPPASALTHPKTEMAAFSLQFIALVPLIVGTWRQDLFWIHAGTWLLAGGIILFLIDMLGVLKHLWWPVEVVKKPLVPKAPPSS